MSPEIEAIGLKILDELKRAVGETWDNWTVQEKTLARDCALDAAHIAAKALGGSSVLSEKAQIDAQLANLQAAGIGSVTKTFWNIVTRLLTTVSRILLG